jgi:hypothetical protein
LIYLFYKDKWTKQKRSYIDITMKLFLYRYNRLDMHSNFRVNIFWNICPITGVWKYWNVLLVPGQVIWKKLLVRTNSYLFCFLYKHLILTNTVAKLNLFILSITSLHKIWNIVLIKLTQTSLPKWLLSKWRLL